jgi:predicted small metal-binding protein
MAKQLKCGDLMPGCDFVAKGATEAEVLEKAAAHAKTAHGLQQVTPELAAKVKGAIKDA